MVKQAADVKDDEAALLAVCGSDSMVERVKSLWDDITQKNKMDVSDQGLTDDAVVRLLKGLHMCVPVARPHDGMRALESPLRVIPPRSRPRTSLTQDGEDHWLSDGAYQAIPHH